jgi:hypothetical protein
MKILKKAIKRKKKDKKKIVVDELEDLSKD